MKNGFFSKTTVLSLGLIGALALGHTGFFGMADGAPANTYLPQVLVNGNQVQRWNNNTQVVNVNIQPGRSLKGWDNRRIVTLKSAFSEWQRALGGKIKFQYTTDLTKTDIIVKWRQRSKGIDVGEQQTRWKDNTLLNADIELSLQTNEGQFLTPNEQKFVALHEVGHALGLQGHSPNQSDIMFADVQPNLTKLSARDIATIRALYNKPPHITNPNGINLFNYRQYLYHVDMGSNAFNRKDFKLALEYFQKAHSYYPKDEKVPYFIGVSAYNLKKYAIAIPYLKRGAAIPGPDQISAQFYLATAQMIAGAQELEAGKEDVAVLKLKSAKDQFAALLKNPKAPADIRTKSNKHLKLVNDALATTQ